MTFSVLEIVGVYHPYTKSVQNFNTKKEALDFLTEKVLNSSDDDLVTSFILRKNIKINPTKETN